MESIILDEILNLFKDGEMKIINELKKNSKSNLSDSQFLTYVVWLFDNKYLLRTDSSPKINIFSIFKISGDGLLLLKNGGFIKKEEDENLEKNENSNLKQLIKQETALSIEKLVNENQDYLKTRGRANFSFWTSIILATVSIISLFVSIRSCQLSKSSPKSSISAFHNHSLSSR